MLIRKVTYCLGCGTPRMSILAFSTPFSQNLKYSIFRRGYMCKTCHTDFPKMTPERYREIKDAHNQTSS